MFFGSFGPVGARPAMFYRSLAHSGGAAQSLSGRRTARRLG